MFYPFAAELVVQKQELREVVSQVGSLAAPDTRLGWTLRYYSVHLLGREFVATQLWSRHRDWDLVEQPEPIAPEEE